MPSLYYSYGPDGARVSIDDPTEPEFLARVVRGPVFRINEFDRWPFTDLTLCGMVDGGRFVPPEQFAEVAR